jgi:RimJ/RimL family protein N-acetyltransferase
MKDNHQFIGQVTLARLPDQDKWAIAYWIHPDYWDLGYATETTKTMVKYGYDHLKAKSIWAGVGTWNTGSIRVFEKPGMRLVADNPAGYTIGGKPIVTQEFEMSISAWRGTNRYHKC